MISEEKRNKCIQGIIDFFETERDEKIGVISAGEILDHFLQNLGIELYNKGVEDTIKFMKERLESLELDMEALLKKR